MRKVGMVAMMAAMLSEGLSGANVDNAQWHGGQRGGFGGRSRRSHKSKLMSSPKSEKLRKSKKRQENKSRAINAAIRRAA